MNCPNCNAPVRSEYCEYCGTCFDIVKEPDRVCIPIYVNGEKLDEVITSFKKYGYLKVR